MDSIAITLLAAIIPILLLMLWQGHLDRKLIRTEIKSELKEVAERLTQVQTDVAYIKGQLNPIEPKGTPSSQPPSAPLKTVEAGTASRTKG